MQGRLFTLFSGTDLEVGFPSYFVLLVTGFILATAMGAVWARRVGHDPDVVVDLGIAMLIFGVAGARILHVLADGYFWDYVHLCTEPAAVAWKISETECTSLGVNAESVWWWPAPVQHGVWDAAASVCHPTEKNCLAWAEIWNGGLAYYGGFLGASLAAWYLLKRDRFPFWRAADMAGMVVPIGLGFGRMGCLLAGCCFGKPWESTFAMKFPGHSPASEWQFKAGLLGSAAEESLTVYPTQMLESLASFAIAAWLILHAHERKRYDGEVFIGFVGLYAAARFVLEIWRSDDRGEWLGLSTSQWIGALLIVALVFAHRRFLGKRSPALGAVR